MESPVEVVAAALYSSSSSSTGGGGAKRKRTKRGLRAFSSPPPLPPPLQKEEEEEDYSSTTTTATEEEEDTAHCLILLARGRGAEFGEEEEETKKLYDVDVGYYECKTCGKRFPSFQALGGHRTSHRMPRLRPADDKIAAVVDRADGPGTIGTGSASAAADGRLRLHGCSICGSEFASGQALGGHMRRHRPAAAAAAAAAAPSSKEEGKSVLLLSLDLNLPAPTEENNSMAAVPFAGPAAAFADQRPMALVV